MNSQGSLSSQVRLSGAMLAGYTFSSSVWIFCGLCQKKKTMAMYSRVRKGTTTNEIWAACMLTPGKSTNCMTFA